MRINTFSHFAEVEFDYKNNSTYTNFDIQIDSIVQVEDPFAFGLPNQSSLFSVERNQVHRPQYIQEESSLSRRWEASDDVLLAIDVHLSSDHVRYVV